MRRKVEKFCKQGLNITLHSQHIKEGMDLPESMLIPPPFRHMQRILPDKAFKEAKHPFRIIIVCAAEVTGFDVPIPCYALLRQPSKDAYADAGYRPFQSET